MKLDYNIIWIDDKIDTTPYRAIVKQVEKYVTEQFFSCNIITMEDYDEFKAVFDSNIQYDLIITDLSLNNGTTGTQVIDDLRQSKQNHTEVLFYTANSNFKDIKLINNNRITFFQLVSENSYRDLAGEIIDLINLTIKKFQHIVAMRGMIMHETSTLDVEMMDLLDKIIKTNGAGNVIPVIKEKYKETNEQFNKDIDVNNDIPFILHKIGSEHRWRAIVRNTEKGEIKTIIDNYKKEIIDERNRFAHAVLLKETGTGREYFQGKQGDTEFNENKCKEIRLNIAKHKKNIEELKDKLRQNLEANDILSEG